MSHQKVEWKDPMTPWELIEQRYFDGQGPEVPVFCKKHGLDEAEVEKVFKGEETRLSPELCLALKADTGMSDDFFKNLSDRYQQAVAA